MQFVVTAMDHKDPAAIERRMLYREAHLEAVKAMIADGKFLSGGAILDDKGKMIGSTLHLDFPDLEALEKHIENDPYTIHKVWEEIDIKPVKLVPLK